MALTAVLHAFGLGPEASVEPLGGGHIHRSWLVAGTGASFVVQQVNTAVFTDLERLQANTLRVVDHLRARGAVAAEPVPAVDGRLWWTAPAGEVWRAFVHLDGVHSAEPVGTAAQAEQVGRGFGRFAALLADLPPPPLVPTLARFHDLGARWAACRDAAARAAGTALAGLAAVDAFDELARHDHLAGAFSGLPLRVAHGDAKAGNVLLDAGGSARAVVDLDTVGPAPLLVDAGDLLRSATGPAAEDEVDLARVVIDEGWLEAVLRGWLGELHDVLTDEEVGRLLTAGQAICWEQAVRFLTDHLEGDRYYGATRPGHNLDRTRTQLRLLEQLVAGRSAHERLVARLWRGGG